MTKKQIYSGLNNLVNQLDREGMFEESDQLFKVVVSLKKDIVREQELEKQRRGCINDPQDSQLEDCRLGVSEETQELRLNRKRVR